MNEVKMNGMNEIQRASGQEGTFFDLSDLPSNMDLHQTPPLSTHRAFHLSTKPVSTYNPSLRPCPFFLSSNLINVY